MPAEAEAEADSPIANTMPTFHKGVGQKSRSVDVTQDPELPDDVRFTNPLADNFDDDSMGGSFDEERCPQGINRMAGSFDDDNVVLSGESDPTAAGWTPDWNGNADDSVDPSEAPASFGSSPTADSDREKERKAKLKQATKSKIKKEKKGRLCCCGGKEEDDDEPRKELSKLERQVRELASRINQ